MRKKILYHFSSLLFISLSAFAQGPSVKVWDYRYGGSSWDVLSAIVKTTDGGFLLAGYSISNISGDKTESTWGLYDYWVVKTDSAGIKQWDRDFGGSGEDWLLTAIQTTDGGYLLAGSSDSPISGNKTQGCWGSFDYWLVKLDSSGNFAWDKTIGGTGEDNLQSVRQTPDGGFILGGYSDSGISGDKTEATWGVFDYWIVKTDSSGNLQWQKDIGGTGKEQLYVAQPTRDGGYIIGGYSNSQVTGDKTQPTWGGTGDPDFWIVKTDSIGIKIWDMDLGGTNDDLLYSGEQTSDGGFILGGTSTSPVGGDKSDPNWDPSGLTTDWWVVKTDSSGNKQWDRTLGGTSPEEMWHSSQISGGYIFSGDSYSPASGNKTENNLGIEQTWVVKTDPAGNIQWDKTVFTTGHDETGLVVELPGGCYLMANLSNGNIGGHKSQLPVMNSWDYWMVKFCDTTVVPVALFTAPHHLCPGTCTEFTNLSLYALSYEWSFPGASPSSSSDENPSNICYNTPGTYDVTLVAANNNGTDTITLPNYITVYPFSPSQTITQSGDTLFSLTGFVTYQWFYNGDTIPGATDYFYIATQSGDYSLICADTYGCSYEAVVLNVIAGIEEASEKGSGMKIYPNPVYDYLEIRPTVKSFPVQKITIYSAPGDRVLTILNPCEFTNCQGTDVGFLSPGIYFLEVTGKDKTYRARFVKN